MKSVDNFCRDLHKNSSMQFGDTLVKGWFVKMSKYRNLHWNENVLMESHFGLLSCCWQCWLSHISKISSAAAAGRYIRSQSQNSSPKKVHHLIPSILEESWSYEGWEEKTNLCQLLELAIVFLKDTQSIFKQIKIVFSYKSEEYFLKNKRNEMKRQTNLSRDRSQINCPSYQ